MAFYIHGLKLGDGPIATRLSSGTDINTREDSIFGATATEVEIVSIGRKSIDLEILLDGDCFDSIDHPVEYISEHMTGLVERLCPLHLRSDEIPIYGGSKDVFVMITSHSVDWKTGTRADQMRARISLSGSILGTLGNLQAKYGVISQTRNGDYTGLTKKSIVSIPGAPVGGFIQTHNIAAWERRNGTLMIDLGDPATGFANDKVDSLAFDSDVGELIFSLDLTNRNYLNNEINVYDDSFSPRMRVYSTTHEFMDDITIESELYKIVVDQSASTLTLYPAVGVGVYDAVPFTTVTMPTFNFISMVMNKEHFVRFKTDVGDYFELERGKDLLVQLQNNDAGGFSISNAFTGSTTGSVNYVTVSGNFNIGSNYQFTVTGGAIAPVTANLADQVYQFAFHDTALVTEPAGGNGLASRMKECLKEIS